MPEHQSSRYRDRPPVDNNIIRMLCGRPTAVAHDLICEHVKLGDRVVDATLGNGYDTIFLAGLVGPTGHVDSFDIQKEAIESAREKLREHNTCSNQVTLHHASHEKIGSLVKTPLQAVMFNLGYLPGGDKQVITRAASTLSALQAALDLLLPGGIVSIVAYIGHPGGMEEGEALRVFCRALEGSAFSVTFHESPSDNPIAPFLITINRD